jgi:hypothetical protein
MTRAFNVTLVAAVLLAFGVGGTPVAAAPDAATCIAKARAKAAKAIAKGVPRYDARRQLEIDVVSCDHPNMAKETAAFIGTVNADLAQFANDFLLGTIDGVTYRNARLDRSRKLRELGADGSLHQALRKGDADGDLIPDDRDRCPRTPAGVPTDDAGCPVDGDRRGPSGTEPDFRRLLAGMTLLRNEACDGAPEPLASQPFRYGRSPTNVPIPAGSFKLVVAQVGGMPAGCEIFYEFRLHYIDSADANAPPTKDVSLVYSENEDLDPDPNVAIFGLPVGQTLSPGRTAALAAFGTYVRMRWRVRTAIGGPVTSPWSNTVTQATTVGGIP